MAKTQSIPKACLILRNLGMESNAIGKLTSRTFSSTSTAREPCDKGQTPGPAYSYSIDCKV